MPAESLEARIVPGLLAAVVYRAPWHPLADAFASRAERLLLWDSAPGRRTLLGSLALHLLWRGQVDRLERILLRIGCHRSAMTKLLGLDPDEVNPNGSGISLGHPVGAAGALIATEEIYQLRRIGGRYVTMCIGGGQGIASVFETS